MRSKLAGVGGFVVLVGAAIGVMVVLHKRDPGNQAEAHATELVRAAHSGAKPEVALGSLDTLIAGDEWNNISDATRGLVGAEVVRLAVELVPKPFTTHNVDDANRVVGRYRALPDAGRHGAARDTMLSTLEGWIKALPAADDREARIALLQLELGVADGNDTQSIAPRLATERLEMARAIEDAWPVDALGFLAVEPRDPAGVPEAGKIYARLGKLKESDAELADLLDRKDGEISLRVAQVYRSIGNERRAIAIATEVQTTSTTPSVQQLAARLLGVMVRTDEERERWYRKADIANPQVKSALLEIEGRRLLREGKGAECDKKLAEAVSLIRKDAPATDSVAMNNAALVNMQRFGCTGDLSVLREAEADLERAYRGASDQPLQIANLAQMLRSNADLRVLAKRIDVGALRLRTRDATMIIHLLLEGPERAAVLADLIADPGWRRSAELLAQYEVLAPASSLSYYDGIDRALRTRDEGAAAAMLERLKRAKAIDTSASDEAYRRDASGQDDTDTQAELAADIARNATILEGKLDPRSRAAALILQSDAQIRYGAVFDHPDLLTAANASLREAAKLWPAVLLESSIASALVDQAGSLADASRWAKLRHERGGATIVGRLVAAKDPLAAKIRATPAWAEIAAHLRAAAKTRPGVDDLRLALLLDDPAILSWANQVSTDKVARLVSEAGAILSPTDPRWSESVTLLGGK